MAVNTHPILSLFDIEQQTAIKLRNRMYEKSKAVIAEQHGQWLIIMGDTYPRIGKNEDIRSEMYNINGQFVRPLQGWVIKASDLTPPIKSQIDKIIGELSDELSAASTQDEAIVESTPIQTLSPALSEKLPAWYIPPSWWGRLNTYLNTLARPSIAIVGPAGNGKTTSTEMAMLANDISYYIMNCTDRTEVTDLIGGDKIRAGGEEFVEGIVLKAFREGKGVILDEADALDPRVMMSLQTALLDPGPDGTSRFIALPSGEKVYPTGLCPIIMTLNTFGTGANRQYNGRNKLDSASIDRLTVISTGFENEIAVLKARGYDKALATKICNWANGIRQKIDEAGLPLILSPRTMLKVAQCIKDAGWTFQDAIEFEYYQAIDPKFREFLV